MLVSLRSPSRLALVAAATLLLTSCGGSGPQIATVTGKVVFNGQPVTAGNLTFIPKTQANGRPASGVIREDGTYITGTFSAEDGVLIGAAAVSYAAPSIDNKDAKIAYGAPLPQGPYDGLVVKTGEVEIAAGSNVIDIELVRAPKP